MDIQQNVVSIGPINHTSITLVLKKKVFMTPKDYRPIALCNAIYKIVAKVLSNRLRLVLDDLIDDRQSAFVPSRQNFDNVMIAHEMIHMLCSKKV